MTLQELNRHFELRERLEKAEELLSALRAAACPRAHVITGMPHTGGVNDRVGDLAVEIADLEAQTKSLQDKIAENEATINSFITTIENNQTRMIFRLRFIHCLTWGEVAAAVGGYNTDDSVKSICYRFLKGCNAVTRYDA